MILTITLNPSVDRALFVDRLNLGDTNRVRRTETDAGGKGVNLTRVAVELGVMSVATGFIGGASGAYIRRVLDRIHVHHDFIDIAGETRINVSIEDGSGPPTTLNEPGPEIPPDRWETLLDHVRRCATMASWVVLGGSLPPGVPVDGFRTLGRIAKAAGAHLALDADGEAMRLGLEAEPHLVKPNHHEAARLLGYPVDTLNTAVRASRELFQRGVPYALISRGADGAVITTREGTLRGVSPEVEVRSTIGSGDSMIAGFLAGLHRGWSHSECLRLGLAAGAATATTDGSAIGNREKIDALLSHALVEPVP